MSTIEMRSLRAHNFVFCSARVPLGKARALLDTCCALARLAAVASSLNHPPVPPFLRTQANRQTVSTRRTSNSLRCIIWTASALSLSLSFSASTLVRSLQASNQQARCLLVALLREVSRRPANGQQQFLLPLCLSPSSHFSH